MADNRHFTSMMIAPIFKIHVINCNTGFHIIHRFLTIKGIAWLLEDTELFYLYQHVSLDVISE